LVRVHRGGGSYIGATLELAIGRRPRQLNSAERIYLDHAATTPVLPEARAAIADALENWANPSSPHAEGRAARSILDKARQDIADELGWRHDVIFTSGASEAVEIAAKRARIGARAHGATEHAIVPHAMGPQSRLIRVGQDGLIDEAALDAVLAEGPALVAIQQVNNETGVIQPLDWIGERIREAGSLLLADCAQGAGKVPLPDADFVAACAHKLGGPPGIGVLLVKDLGTLEAVGGQERGYRRGTQDAPSAAAFAAAVKARPYDLERLQVLRSYLDEGVVCAGGVVIADQSPKIPTIGSYAMPGVASSSQLAQFDLAGLAVSAGSACSSGSMKPSVVLEAMGLSPEIASCFIRVSFGPRTTECEVDRFLGEWRKIHDRAASRAA
jgi:cysteine desulfurase